MFKPTSAYIDFIIASVFVSKGKLTKQRKSIKNIVKSQF